MIYIPTIWMWVLCAIVWGFAVIGFLQAIQWIVNRVARLWIDKQLEEGYKFYDTQL